MADDLSALLAERTRLREIRAKGIRSYEISTGSGSRRLEYRTDRELKDALDDLERRISALTRPAARVVYINSSKGT